MPRKPKFRPRITRIKLNPEQAVLQCSCYSGGQRAGGATHFGYWVGLDITICTGRFFSGAQWTGNMSQGVMWDGQLSSS